MVARTKKDRRRRLLASTTVGLILVLLRGQVAATITPTPIRHVLDAEFSPVPTLSPSPEPTSRPTQSPPQATRRPEPAKVGSTPTPTKQPTPRPSVKTRSSLRGVASWFCSVAQPICFHSYPPGSNVAAAGPALRAAICGVQSCTSWRNRRVYVNGVPVILRDWCQCHWHEPIEKTIDLYKSVFDRTGSSVTITW